jgi:hypothetical protein
MGVRVRQDLFFYLAWWCIPVIPELRRVRQEDHEFETSLSYKEIPCLKPPEKI